MFYGLCLEKYPTLMFCKSSARLTTLFDDTNLVRKNFRRCLMEFKNSIELFRCSQCSVRCCTRLKSHLATRPKISSNNPIHFISTQVYWHSFQCNVVLPRCDYCAVAITDAMAQLGLSKSLINLTTLQSNIENFWFFLLSIFGEMFDTFDRGLRNLLANRCVYGRDIYFNTVLDNVEFPHGKVLRPKQE